MQAALVRIRHAKSAVLSCICCSSVVPSTVCCSWTTGRVEDDETSPGLKTPDVEPMYATSRLLTVRTKEELEKVAQKTREQADAQVADQAVGDAAVAEADAAASMAADAASSAAEVRNA